jgi:hypothetical protein
VGKIVKELRVFSKDYQLGIYRAISQITQQSISQFAQRSPGNQIDGQIVKLLSNYPLSIVWVNLEIIPGFLSQFVQTLAYQVY